MIRSSDAPSTRGEAGAGLAAGLGALLGGRVADARRLLHRAADEDSAEPVLGTAAALGAGVAGLLAGDARAVVETERAVAAAEVLGLGWLARVGRAALAVARSPVGAEYGRSDATAVREAAAREEDRWGEALAALAEGWSALDDPEAALEPFDVAATRFRALGAGSLEAWARSLEAVAMARAGSPDAREAALGAEAVARSTGVAVGQAVAHVALWPSLACRERDELAQRGRGPPGGGRPGAPGRARRVRTRAIEADVAPTVHAGCPRAPAARRDSALRRLRDGHRRADDRSAGLKPRPRAILRFLALNEGRPIHREVLQETFWPEADGRGWREEPARRALGASPRAGSARRAGCLRAARSRR